MSCKADTPKMVTDMNIIGGCKRWAGCSHRRLDIQAAQYAIRVASCTKLSAVMLSSQDCSSDVWAADEASYSMGGVKVHLGYSCGKSGIYGNDGHSHINCRSRNQLDRQSSLRRLNCPSESICVGIVQGLCNCISPGPASN